MLYCGKSYPIVGCVLYWQGDGRPFWKLVVSEATGCADDNYFEDVYQVMFYEQSYLVFMLQPDFRACPNTDRN